MPNSISITSAVEISPASFLTSFSPSLKICKIQLDLIILKISFFSGNALGLRGLI